MLAEVVEIAHFEPVVARSRRGRKPKTRTQAPPPPKAVLDIIDYSDDGLDDHLALVDTCLRRMHCATVAARAAKPGSWAHDYWNRVHRQLKRRRESLDVPWTALPRSNFAESLCGTPHGGWN